MKKNFKLLLAALTALGLVGAAAACSTTPDNSSTPEASTPAPATYTVTFVADGETVGTVTYTEGDDSILEPEVPAKDHYTGAWEAYTLDGDVTVNAVYTLKEYTVTFVADGATVATEGYTIDNTTVTAPEVPAKEGYTGAWEAYELTSGDITVNAVYTAIEYEIHFVHPRTGMDIAAPITYTVETLDQIEFPAVPDGFAPEGYTAKWDKTVAEVTAGGCIVTVELAAIEYEIHFVHPRTGMDIAEPITYTVENMADVVFPEIPEGYLMAGYTMSWDKTASDLAIGGLVVALAATANTYTITYELNGGSTENDLTAQEVVFDSEYELLVASPAKSYQSFLGWKDEDGNMVAAEGIWAIAGDVTLTAVYSDGIDFETMTAVPSYITGSRVQSFAIVEMNGNKVLEGTTTADSTSDIGVHFNLDALKEFFEDKNTAYLAFDLKSGADREGNKVYYQKGDASGWQAYEGGNFNTIPTDTFKTYFLPRATFEAWIANSITNPRILLIGGGLVCGGEKFYIDNIRPATESEYKATWFSFETGDMRKNNGNSPLYYTYNSDQWQIAFSNVNSSTVHFTSDIVSDGNRALTFTKLPGDTALTFNHNYDYPLETAMREAGYITYDLYVPEGSDASIISKSAFKYPLAKGWNTVYAKIYADSNEFSRFNDTTGSTYVIDNIRLISAEEYNAAAMGFELGGGVLRTAELGNAETNSGVAYYYSSDDTEKGKYSFAFSEGNGSNDLNVLSNIRFDTQIKRSGKASIAFDKGNGYMSVTMNARDGVYMYPALSSGFTFWIYSTVEIDATTTHFINGSNAQFNAGAGMVIPANTWTQVTVRAEDINSTGRFLIMQGNWEGTIYLDDFQPLN